ncbi:beta strand repeat-containing protein, partial [Flavobacterium hydatis]
MKNKLLPLLFVLCGYTAYSQVGIGTPLPNASSQLEVVASDKGILIPRIKLTSSTDTATITNGNQNSLLVFNTNNVADVTAGYYYWYDNKWNRIVISNEVAPSTGTVIYNPTTQQFTYVDGSGVTQTVDFTQVVQSSETVTTLDKDPANDGKYVYKSENDTETTIDVVGDVINNASTIVNNPNFTTQLVNVIKTDETLTTLTKDAANDGKYLYTSENATGTTIDVVGDVITNSSTILNNPAFKTEITNVIKDEETITTLVNNGGGSYTYNNEAGTPVNIDVVGDVTTNFSTIANNPAVTNIIQEISTKTEGAVTFDSRTNQFSYTDATGTPQVVDISAIVKANETITTLDKDPANNGKYVYTSENTTGTTIDVVGDVITNASTILSDPTFTTELTNIITANETLTTLVNNGGGSYTYNNEAGTPVNIDVVGDVTTNFSTIANNPAVTTIIQEISTKTEGAVTFDSTTNQFSYTDATGTPQVVDISAIVKANETVTTLDKDPANNGKYVYTSENTTGTTIDVVGDVIANASTILNDPTFTTELTNIITANETVTTLVNNGGGSYTYNNEAGTPVNIDVVGDVTTNFSTIANNPAVTTIIENIATKTVGAVTFDSTTNQFSYTDATGTPQLVDISAIVKANETVTTLDKDPANNGKYVYTSENTTGTTIDVVGDVITNASTILNDPSFKTELTNVIKTEETVTTLDKDPANDGKYLYTSENATATTIDVVGDVITNASTILNDPSFKTELTNVIKTEETVTTLVNNGGGSYTYNNEAGTPVNIDVVGDVTTNFSTIANNPAVTTIIQEIATKTAGAVTFDSTTNQFSYTDATGTPQLVDISAIVKANETVTTLDKDPANNGKYVYTSENTTGTTIDVVGDVITNASTILNDPSFKTELTNVIKTEETVTTLDKDPANDGKYLYTSENATATTIDVVGDVITNASTILNDPSFKTELTNVIKTEETVTTLVNNGAGSYTYNNEAAAAVNIDVVGDVISNASTIVNNPAFVTELTNVVKAEETITTQAQSLTTGAITYTNEAGTAVTS